MAAGPSEMSALIYQTMTSHPRRPRLSYSRKNINKTLSVVFFASGSIKNIQDVHSYLRLAWQLRSLGLAPSDRKGHVFAAPVVVVSAMCLSISMHAMYFENSFIRT